MLKSIELENFKAFGERSVISLAPITLIYGQNSAGKSSILQALQLLKQSLENKDVHALLLPRSDTSFVDLGSFKELMFDHDLARNLSIRLTFDEPRSSPLRSAYARADYVTARGLEFTFADKLQNGEVELKHIDLCSRNSGSFIARFAPVRKKSSDMANNWQGQSTDTVEMVLKSWGDDADEFWEKFFFDIRKAENEIIEDLNYFIKEIRRFSSNKERGERHDLDTESTSNLSTQIETMRSLIRILNRQDAGGFIRWAKNQCSATRLAVNGFIPVKADVPFSSMRKEYYLAWKFRVPFSRELLEPWRVITDAAIAVGKETLTGLSSLFPLGPFRRPPSRWYVFTGTTPHHVGYQGNLMPDLLFRKNDIADETNAWLRRLDLGYEIEVNRLSVSTSDIFEVRLIDTRRSQVVRVGLSDVGFGISQILPLVVQSLVANDQIITVEQPEVHIHPKLQADMGELFASSARVRSNQYIIETHSEHLALRILSLVRKGQLNPQDVSILYIERGSEGSSIVQIQIDEDGYFIDEFPGGFFPERLNELQR